VSTSPIVARIARLLAVGEAVDGLVRALSPTDLQSLMLHVYRERSARRTPKELLAQYERSKMVQTSTVDPRALVELERAAFAAASAFEAVELAPVAPLGLNAVLGEIDQNNCLATVRGAEVSADPTTAKALECARRRRAGVPGPFKLCSRSRQLRLQPFDNPAFSPHFGLFSMVSADRDRGSFAFEVESLKEHLGVYLTLLGALAPVGFRFGGVTVAVSDTARDETRLLRAQADVLDPLAAAFPAVAFSLDRTREQGRSYYSGLCLQLNAVDTDGVLMNLADGGFTTWTQRLLSNGKERLLVSGIGLELIAKRFGGAT
jgi:hypothetical protein